MFGFALICANSSLTLLWAIRLDVDRGGVLVDQRERRILLGGEIGQPDPVHQIDLERDETEGVAVGCGGRDRLVADHARPAGAVDDVDRLLEIAFQHLGDLARHRVGAAAGGPRHDQRDRPLRERRLGVAGPEQAGGRKCGKRKISEMAKHSQILPALFLMRRVRHRDARFMRCPPFRRRSADMSRGSAVEQLAPRELARFRAWFEAYDARQFDAAIERDIGAGKLMPMRKKLSPRIALGIRATCEAFRFT